MLSHLEVSTPGTLGTVFVEPEPVTLVCLSDMHSQAPPSLPDGDVLILAGDLSEGRPAQLLSSLSELAAHTDRYIHIVIIGGNHDHSLSPACDNRDVAIYNDLEERLACRHAFASTPGVTYLDDCSVEPNVRGRTLHLCGSPASIATSRQTAFGYIGEDALQLWEKVPERTDVLATHGPPAGYLDGGMGCLS